jgi:hypothetical protein
VGQFASNPVMQKYVEEDLCNNEVADDVARIKPSYFQA